MMTHNRRAIVSFAFFAILVCGLFVYIPRSKDHGQSARQTIFAAQLPASSNVCQGNTLPQVVIVSISSRTLWACEASRMVYSSPVVTGMETLPADLTPVGTYQVQSKQANLFLDGSDTTGSWHDYVHYWMPFLVNQYGTYGFHDAMWRNESDFGNIDPYTSKASHGCVELPLKTAAWLYGWASVGMTVTIKS